MTDFNDDALRTAQKVMLHILKTVHTLCEKHHLTYWLDYGTLLGAIRHNGFIPWDDDVDICMPRADYEKFCAIAPAELGPDFLVQTPQSDPTYWFEFAKVKLLKTLWRERKADIAGIAHPAIYLDIFPIDHLPKNKVIRWLTTHFCDILCNGVIRYQVFGIKSRSPLKRCGQALLSTLISAKRVNRWRRALAQKLQRLPDTTYVSKIALDTRRDLCPKTLFTPLILHPFETEQFYIPAQYDRRLKQLFGDYMTPPPETKRHGHHDILEYDFGPYANL